MDNYYTYVYSDSLTKQPFYVGKGKNERAWSHFSRTDKHPLTYKINKLKSNGISIMVSLYSGLDEEFSLFLEEELIAKYGRKDLGTGCLLNLTNGGEGSSGRIASDTLRKNMSKAKSGQKYSEIARKNMSEASKNRVYTTERNKNVSKGLTGHLVSEETKKKISEKAKIYNAGEHNGMFGKTHTEEAKQKQRDSALGRRYSPEVYKKMHETRRKNRLAKLQQIGEQL